MIEGALIINIDESSFRAYAAPKLGFKPATTDLANTEQKCIHQNNQSELLKKYSKGEHPKIFPRPSTPRLDSLHWESSDLEEVTQSTKLRFLNNLINSIQFKNFS